MKGMGRRIFIPALALGLLAAGAAAGQGLFGAKTDYATLSLHSGWAEADRRVAGLRLELAPGWKTYWRSPGDSGVPPHFDWSGSENLAAVAVDWPAPEVFESFGATTIGYKGRMVLPLTLTPVDPARPIDLRLAFTYGVCDEICIPAREEVAMTIPPGAPEEGGVFIRAALRDRPVGAAEGGVTAAACRVEGAGETRRFTADIAFAAPPAAPPLVVVEGPEGVWFGPVETRMVNGALTADGAVHTEAGRWIDRSELSVTLLSDAGAVALPGCAARG